jgi:large subunit ribosomal protein L13
LKTFSPKPRDIERRWYVIDADGAVLGRLASEVAKILRGKHKPIFAPHADTGDHVIVVNAKGVRLTGGKEDKKIAYHHSGYPGGIKGVPYRQLMAERPKFAVERAVKGMLPSNRLGRQMAKKLSVYDGPDHRHQAQKPEQLALGQIPKWQGLPKPKPAQARPEPKPEAKPRRTARRPTAGPTAKRSTAKSTARSTAKSTARSSAKSTAKSTAKRSTAKTARTPAAKESEAKPTTRRSRRTKKTEES